MNREQLARLIAALQTIHVTSRRDAIERAMRVIDGKATLDEVFGTPWGERTWGVEPWGEVRRLGNDGKKLGDGRRLGDRVAPPKENE